MSFNVSMLPDLYRAGTIKPTDALVAICIQERPMRVYEISERLGISVRTVQRSLGRLARAALARKRARLEGRPLFDEWELAEDASEVAYDRSEALSKQAMLKADRIDHNVTTDTQPLTDPDVLAVQIADHLCLPQSVSFIAQAIRSVPEMPAGAILRVADRVKGYIWRPDGSRNPFVRQPAAYFASSLQREWAEIQRYLRAQEGSPDTTKATPKVRTAATLVAGHHSASDPSKPTRLGALLPCVLQGQAVGYRGKLLLASRRRMESPEKRQDETPPVRIPGMFASLAEMLRERGGYAPVRKMSFFTT